MEAECVIMCFPVLFSEEEKLCEMLYKSDIFIDKL